LELHENKAGRLRYQR